MVIVVIRRLTTLRYSQLILNNEYRNVLSCELSTMTDGVPVVLYI